MYEYDKTFDRKVFLGHCDLISWFSDFAYDLISCFSDFALYLNTEWVYDHISFTL